MLKKELTIINKLGLHARASTKFVNMASRFRSHIELSRGTHTVNGKSIMGVLTLGATKGTTVTLIADGADEQVAMDSLEQLIADRFGESE